MIDQKPLNGKYNCILNPKIMIRCVRVPIETGLIYVAMSPKPILYKIYHTKPVVSMQL